jgi:hypothetical protein
VPQLHHAIITADGDNLRIRRKRHRFHGRLVAQGWPYGHPCFRLPPLHRPIPTPDHYNLFVRIERHCHHGRLMA